MPPLKRWYGKNKVYNKRGELVAAVEIKKGE